MTSGRDPQGELGDGSMPADADLQPEAAGSDAGERTQEADDDAT